MVFLQLVTLNQSFISSPNIFRLSLLNITNQSILFSYQQCSAWLLFWFWCYLELGSSTLPFGAGGFAPVQCTVFPISDAKYRSRSKAWSLSVQLSPSAVQFQFIWPLPRSTWLSWWVCSCLFRVYNINTTQHKLECIST